MKKRVQPVARLVALALVFQVSASTAELDRFIPESLRSGHGTLADVREQGEMLDGGYRLEERDVDCDGEPELLLEWLLMRGATGNRGYLLFDRLPTGYIYRGEVSGIVGVLDYGTEGGCYLATYGKGGAGLFVVHLASTRDGQLEPSGFLELRAGDSGYDEDNALVAALGANELSEDRLLRLFSTEDLPEIGLDEPFAVPWVRLSTVAEEVEVCEKYGALPRQRVHPREVSTAWHWSEWWGPVPPRLVRLWTGTLEGALIEHSQGEARPAWFPNPERGSIEITGVRVLGAARLTGRSGRKAGVVVGRFETTMRWLPDQPARAIELSWAAVFAISALGEPQELLWWRLGAVGEGESRGIFVLERVTNVDDDPEFEIVIDEEGYAGRGQWVIDLSDPEALAQRELAVSGCD